LEEMQKHRSLNALMVQPKNIPFGDNTAIEQKVKETRLNLNDI
jgi:hypothetical protein